MSAGSRCKRARWLTRWVAVVDFCYTKPHDYSPYLEFISDFFGQSWFQDLPSAAVSDHDCFGGPVEVLRSHESAGGSVVGEPTWQSVPGVTAYATRRAKLGADTHCSGRADRCVGNDDVLMVFGADGGTGPWIHTCQIHHWLPADPLGSYVVACLDALHARTLERYCWVGLWNYAKNTVLTMLCLNGCTLHAKQMIAFTVAWSKRVQPNFGFSSHAPTQGWFKQKWA